MNFKRIIELRKYKLVDKYTHNNRTLKLKIRAVSTYNASELIVNSLKLVTILVISATLKSRQPLSSFL